MSLTDTVYDKFRWDPKSKRIGLC